MKTFPIISFLVSISLLVLSQSIYTVDQRQFAIVFQFGEAVNIRDTPGLYLKLPLMQNIRHYEKRILTFDSPEAERFQTVEKKNVLVDSFIKWRIVDVKKYYETVRGNEELAKQRLNQTINDNLRAEFGKRTIHEVISSERGQIMNVMRDKANQDAKGIGVEIIDVRLKRVDFSQDVADSVYRRMEAERKRVANELRSTGAADAERIKADADRQREIILAEAYKEAQEIKGIGDAKAAAIYAAAYGQNAEFYSFYRSLEAYKQSFRSKSDVLVLEPQSEFFKYLKDSGSGKK